MPVNSIIKDSNLKGIASPMLTVSPEAGKTTRVNEKPIDQKVQATKAEVTSVQNAQPEQKSIWSRVKEGAASVAFAKKAVYSVEKGTNALKWVTGISNIEAMKKRIRLGGEEEVVRISNPDRHFEGALHAEYTGVKRNTWGQAIKAHTEDAFIAAYKMGASAAIVTGVAAKTAASLGIIGSLENSASIVRHLAEGSVDLIGSTASAISWIGSSVQPAVTDCVLPTIGYAAKTIVNSGINQAQNLFESANKDPLMVGEYLLGATGLGIIAHGVSKCLPHARVEVVQQKIQKATQFNGMGVLVHEEFTIPVTVIRHVQPDWKEVGKGAGEMLVGASLTAISFWSHFLK